MIITQTPLRISFLGGGTDFPGFYRKYSGCVVTAAVDKYVYCIVKERFDKQIYVNYSVKEIVNRIDDLKHELVREAMRKTQVTQEVEITFLSDVPASGSGLGSSSAVTVGVLNALYQFTGRAIDAGTLARQACDIEIKILKKPIGVQDQYITAFGGVKYLQFAKNGRVEVEDLCLSKERLDDLKSYLMVFFTGRTRPAETVLREQQDNISHKNQILKQMAAQAQEGKQLLKAGKFLLLGKLLHKGWLLKKRLASRVSDTEIDKIYDSALRAGAIGGKISGAGGGGFLTLIVPTQNRDRVRHALSDLRETPVGLSPDGSKVIFNIRR